MRHQRGNLGLRSWFFNMAVSKFRDSGGSKAGKGLTVANIVIRSF